ncbi:flavin-containing monooxygenase [Tenacibaculum sp. MEBiC06402]|uniref:flavin-containing monooxygenase n=1 Tax=unclassified Tenacibaculum TaxID=2635139 RepID=UPI003B98FC9A
MHNHDEGYLPEFKGTELFKGPIIHPQHWPKDLNYENKKVVVIGSGATAITIVPSMADKTSHITMLQRSPTYIYSIPSVDKLSKVLRKILSEKTVYKIARFRNVFLQQIIFKLSKKYPKRIQKFLISKIQKQLGKEYDIKHFTPNYDPWDQRLAAVPDNDLFEVIKKGKASVVTDHIDSFTENGILLKSGEHLDADIIITATGLKLQVLGGMELHVDNEKHFLNEKMTYKSVLVQDTPNFAYLFGYTNASWTLKINVATNYLIKLLQEKRNRNAKAVIPKTADLSNSEESVLDSLNSGYVKRGGHLLPRQGKSYPWRVLHNYKMDKRVLKKPIEDTSLNWEY